ncbi:unnamed protein product [Calicophoron daubneyi]|uniref:Glutamate receptor n=1 Tax=Calicophoron daubneyi TaxID=300641 RepID=A0AAV2TWR4_CALDB
MSGQRFLFSVVLIGRNRTDITTAFELAVRDAQALQKEPITWTTYTVEKNQTNVSADFTETICAAVEQGTIPYPDLFIDLSLEEKHACLLGYLARQLDVGLMTLNEVDCSPFVLESVTNASLKYVRIPAMRFPERARIVALTAYADLLFNSNHGEVVYFIGKDIGAHASFPYPTNLQMFGRMLVNVATPVDPVWLEKMLIVMTQTARVEAFVFNLNQETMTGLLNANGFLVTQDYELSKNILTFDNHYNNTVCDIMCYAEDGIILYCGLQYSSMEYWCVEVDTTGGNLTTVLQIQNEFQSEWSSMTTNQLDTLYTYDAVKISLRVVNSLTTAKKWKKMNSTASDVPACTKPLQELTSSTRFYMFAEALTQLPPTPGASGVITFNGTVVNQKSEFRVLMCRTNNDDRLPICVDQEEPFVVKTSSGWSGYAIELFELIANELGLKYVYVEQKDGIYGTKQPDGRWNGMIGSVAYRETDVAIGRLMISNEAEKLIDFTRSTLGSSGVVLLMSTEGDIDTSIGYMDEIFSVNIWLCYFGLALLMSFILWIYEKLSPLRERPSGTTLLDSLWIGFGPLSLQGEPFDPRPISVKMLMWGYWLFLSLVMSVYAANLQAKMQKKSMRGQIDTVDELLLQTEVKYTLRRGSDEYEFFLKMANVEESLYDLWMSAALSNNASSAYTVWQYPMGLKYKTAFNRMRDWGFTANSSESLIRMREGWAIFMESTVGEYYLNTECLLRKVGQQIGSWYYATALPMGSLLKPKYDKILQSLQSDGTLDKLVDKYWSPAQTNCPEAATDESIPQFSSLFIFFAVGAAASIVILQIERTIHGFIMERRKIRERQKSQVDSRLLKQFLKTLHSYAVGDPQPAEKPQTETKGPQEVRPVTQTPSTSGKGVSINPNKQVQPGP